MSEVSLSETMTSLMNSARKIQNRTDKLSISDLSSMLNAIANIKIGGEQWTSDCSNNRGPGIYYCHEEVNSKPTSNDGYLMNITPDENGWNDSSTVTQLFLDRQANTFYRRNMNVGQSWTPWSKIGGVVKAALSALTPVRGCVA